LFFIFAGFFFFFLHAPQKISNTPRRPLPPPRQSADYAAVALRLIFPTTSAEYPEAFSPAQAFVPLSYPLPLFILFIFLYFLFSLLSRCGVNQMMKSLSTREWKAGHRRNSSSGGATAATPVPTHSVSSPSSSKLTQVLTHHASSPSRQPLAAASSSTSPSTATAAASTKHLCALAAGALSFHVLASVLQEHIFHLPGFTNVLLLSFGETLCTTVLVALQLVWLWWRRRGADEDDDQGRHNPREKEGCVDSSVEVSTSSRRVVAAVHCRHLARTLQHIFHLSSVEMYWYVRIAILMSCSLYLTNQTSLLLSYPLQVIFKSSKLLCMIVVRRWWMRTLDQDGQSMVLSEASESDGATSPPSPYPPRLQEQQLSSRSRNVIVRARGGGEAEEAHHVPSSHTVHRTAAPQDSARAAQSRHTSRHHGSLTPPSADTPYAPVPSAQWKPTTPTIAVVAATPSYADENGFAARECRAEDDATISTSAAASSVAAREGVIHVPAVSCSPASHRSFRGGRLGAGSGSRCCSLAAFQRWAGVPARVLCSVREGKHVSARLVRSLQVWRGWGVTALRAARSVGRSLRTTFSTRHGAAACLRACLRCVRGSLLDGELQACTVIVLGLILFTYASQVGDTASTSTDAATVTGGAGIGVGDDGLDGVRWQQGSTHATLVVSPVLHNEAHKTDLDAGLMNTHPEVTAAAALLLEQQQRLPTTAMTTPSSTPLLFHPWRAVMTYAVWVTTLIGVSGVMLSNLIDAVIYVLEEVYCFQTAGSNSSSSSGGAASSAASAHKDSPSSSLPPPFTQRLDAPTPASESKSSSPLPLATQVSSPHQADICVVTKTEPPTSPLPPPPSHHHRTPATSQEVLFMLNGIATFIYGGCLTLSWLTTSRSVKISPASSVQPTPAFPLFMFVLLVALASVTSLIGTLFLLAIVAEYTGVTAVVVTNLRKTLTILLSFMLYGRRFTPTHAIGLTGVMGGVVWNEMLRRQRTGVQS
jgi:hypothetical protein